MVVPSEGMKEPSGKSHGPFSNESFDLAELLASQNQVNVRHVVYRYVKLILPVCVDTDWFSQMKNPGPLRLISFFNTFVIRPPRKYFRDTLPVNVTMAG